MKIVIVGGVAGGASAAARLRRMDEKAEIILLERGDFISFANCALPYFIGGEIKDERFLTLQTPASFNSRFNIDVRVNNEAIDIDPKSNTLTVYDHDTNEEYHETYDRLILSPGAKPIVPPINGIDSQNGIFTLRTIPDTMKIYKYIETIKPKTAAVIGGGYIGVEMAENLAKAGLDVTIIEMADHIIAPLDFDMAAEVQHYIKKKGIKICLNTALQEVIQNENNITLKLQNCETEADMLILSVGVSPETSLAKQCGIRTNKKGAILVNEHMQTNIHDIYAVGDAVGVKNFISGEDSFIPLAGPANKQGRIAADHICSINSKYKGTQGSSIVKCFDMTVASTGLNEKTAMQNGFDFDKTYIYSPSHATYYPGATNMSVKVLWDKDSLRLLGAQIVGFDGVDKRIDVLATAIRFKAKVTDLTELELCYAPPFGSAKDPVNMVGFVAENVVNHKMHQFFWHDVASLPTDSSVTLLDLRTNSEVLHGSIEGFINIPLHELRKNINRLPHDKPVYVYCHSGQRSYIACRILSGYGFECYNLAGGWRLYETVVGERAATEYVCTDC